MSYSEKNYEQVARYMDGESISLDNNEQVLLNEVRDDMLAMGKAMDATVDSDVIERVLKRHRKSPWRTVAGLTAAAAIIVVAAAAWMLTMNNNQAVEPTSPSVAVTNEVVDNLATVQSIIDAQQELDIMAILVQNDTATSQTQTTTTSTEDDPWDMNTWASDFAG